MRNFPIDIGGGFEGGQSGFIAIGCINPDFIIIASAIAKIVHRVQISVRAA